MRRLLKYILVTFSLTIALDIAIIVIVKASPPLAKLLLTSRFLIPASGVALISFAYFGDLLERLLSPSFKRRYIAHSLIFSISIIAISYVITLSINEIPLKVSYSGLELISYDELGSLMLVLSSFLSGMTVNTIASLIEEIGWRGFLLEETIRFGLFRSSIIIGSIWWLWRIPLAFIFTKIYPKHEDILGLISFLLLTLTLSYILSWLRLMSGSLYPVALFNGTLSSISNSLSLPLRVEDELFGFPLGLPVLAASLILAVILVLSEVKNSTIFK
jgi:membrane protease YdiL (CAAX protease family)